MSSTTPGRKSHLLHLKRYMLATCEGKSYTAGLFLLLLRLIYCLSACDPISLYRLEIRLVFVSLHCLRKRFATVHDKSATQIVGLKTKNSHQWMSYFITITSRWQWWITKWNVRQAERNYCCTKLFGVIALWHAIIQVYTFHSHFAQIMCPQLFCRIGNVKNTN